MDIVSKRVRLIEHMKKAGFTTDYHGIDDHLDHFVAVQGGEVQPICMVAEKGGAGVGILGAMKQSFVFAQCRKGNSGKLIEIPRENAVLSIQFGEGHGSQTLRLVIRQPSGRFWKPDKMDVFTGDFRDVQKFHNLAFKSVPGNQL